LLSGKQDDALCNTGTDVKAVNLASDVSADIKAKNIDGGLSEVQRSTYTKAQYANYVLGGNSPEAIARLADIKFGFDGAPAWAGGTPDADLPRTNKLNWGCNYPVVDCARDGDEKYFPVVAIQAPTGGVQFSGGYGQGILIILGDLHINGQFKYSGIVIVVGDLDVNGGAQVQGALIGLGDVALKSLPASVDKDPETSLFNGNALVRYNSCTVATAQDALTKAQMNNMPQAFGKRTFAWYEAVR
ncbi:MAG: hypothetical protein JO040_06665, partial [Gemmatimonadetes bacterium]|nr:hypothetical protein [Gemmatimonadota bacterium]